MTKDYSSKDSLGRGVSEPQGLFGRLKRKWRKWKRNQAIVHEERNALRDINLKKRSKVPSGVIKPRQDQIVSTDFSRQAINEPEGRVLKKTGDSKQQPLGFWARIRRERKLRKQILEERKGMAKSVEKFSQRLKRANSKSGVQLASDKDVPLKRSRRTILRFRKALIKTKNAFIIAKGPQRALAIVPIFGMLCWGIAPATSDRQNRFNAESYRMQAELSGFVQEKKYPEADIAAHRIMMLRITRMDDIFDYYDCLMEQGKDDKAWALLKSQEATQREIDRGSYSFRFVQKILARKNISEENLNLAFIKLNEAINSRLSYGNETTARQLLASIYALRGDLQMATQILEPVQARDVAVTSEVLWLKWNIENGYSLQDVQAKAQSLLKDLDIKITANSHQLNETDISSRSKLLMILNREVEARDWIHFQANMDQESKAKWLREIDKLSLAIEFKKTPFNEKVVWEKVQPVIESDPENLFWIRIVTTLWATAKSNRNIEAYNYVQRRLDSETNSSTFLHMTAMSALVNRRWDLAREIYQMLLEMDSKDVITLNNLATIMYRTPPKDYNLALNLIESALEIQPENAEIKETKGQILARIGRLDESKQVLESCLSSMSNRWAIHNTLAQIYEMQGQKTMSRVHRDWMKSLKKPVDAPAVDELKP
jgi:tetratricopeptide (TPR) repeat protein